MPPNIVVLLLDAARARNLSCYGHQRPTTPFLEALAENAHLYERAFANSIWSLPSYASLFTGQYPSEHGAVDWNQRISENTLVRDLNEAGYETHAVSTHLVSGEFGIADAFDSVTSVFVESRDLPFDKDPVAERMKEFASAEGFDSPHQRYLQFLKFFGVNPSARSLVNGGYQFGRRLKRRLGWWGDDGARDALAEARSLVNDATSPFFLFANFVETHDPYRPPRRYIRQFIPDDVSLVEIRQALDYSSVRATLGLSEISERDRDILKRLYDAELAYLDDQIAQFHKFLQECGYLKDTVFVVLADHGDSFGAHNIWGHQARVYNDLCHVPLIIDYPWSEGESVSGTTEIRSLCSHLSNLGGGCEEPLPPDGSAIVEYHGWDTQLSYAPWDRYEGVDRKRWEAYQCAYIDDRYKLIKDATGTIELYGLTSDITETEDIAGANEDVVREYESQINEKVGRIESNHEEYRTTRDSRERNIFDSGGEVADRLKQLGYTE